MRRHFIIFLLIFSLASCQNDYRYLDDGFFILNKDIDIQIIQITDNINDKVYNHSETVPDIFFEYDNLTKNYIKYLDKIINELSPNYSELSWRDLRSKSEVEDYFFNGSVSEE